MVKEEKQVLMRDPDEIHHKLWARKRLKVRRERNDKKKMRQKYFKTKEDDTADGEIDPKKK